MELPTNIQRDIDHIHNECKSNEELLVKLKTYFLSNIDKLPTVSDSSYLAWVIYNQLIQKKL